VDNTKNVLRVCGNNFLKWRANARVLVTFLLAAIFLYSATDGLRAIAVESDMAVTPWAFPFLSANDAMHQLLFLLAVFLFCDAPFFDEQYPYVCARCGRRVWARGQVLYIFSGAAVYTAALYGFSLLVFGPYLSFSAQWGKLLRTLANAAETLGNTDTGLATGDVAGRILSYYTPLQATGLTLLLTWLGCAFLGLLMFLLNLRFHRAVGSIAAIAFVMMDFFLQVFTVGQGFVMPVLFFFSPLSWSNLARIQVRPGEFSPPAWYAVVVLLGLVVLLSALSLHAMKRRDVEILPEV